MWSFLIRNVLMPATSVLTPHKAWRYYKQYSRWDFDDPADRELRVWEKIRALLQHAYDNTAFYRQRMDEAGIAPQEVKTWEDFCRIPVTTKHELRKHFPDGVIAANYKEQRLRYSNTSGTTGRPFILVQNLADIDAKYAARLRARAMESSYPGDRTLRTTPNECQPCLETGYVTDKSIWEYLKAQAIHGASKTPEYFVFVEKKILNPLVHRRLMLPAIDNEPGEMGDSTFEYYATEMERYKPKLWVTYPLYAYLVAKYIRRTNRAVPKVGIIDLSGGVASPKMVELIADVFGAPTFQSYGGCEFGRYGNECDAHHGKMHVAEDHVYVEVLKPDGTPAADGELGNQIVTSLTNYAMPTIRLEQGDTIVPHGRECPCGRTTRLIDVRGRIQTLIVCADGKTVTEKEVIDALFDCPSLDWFQLIQRSEGELDLNVIQTPGDQPYDPEELKGRLRDLISPSISVDVNTVEHIDQEGSGKYMHVKSCTYDGFRCVSPEVRAADEYTPEHHH